MPEALLEGAPLAPYTTLGVGGPARYLVRTERPEQLERWVQWAAERELDWLVLGHGSNVLVADTGYNGLVIVHRQPTVNRLHVPPSGSEVVLRLSAAWGLADVARVTARRGWAGLEWACGIPGTLGGALAGNAGAFGGCLADCVEGALVVLGGREPEFHDTGSLSFAYRQCGLLEETEPAAVLSVDMRLRRDEEAACQQRVRRYDQLRRQSQPGGRSAGCAFRNPPGRAAGALIDACGLKGLTVGGAQVSGRHANFVVNAGGATASDIVALLSMVRRKVYEHHGVVLEPEVRMIGDVGLEEL